MSAIFIPFFNTVRHLKWILLASDSENESYQTDDLEYNYIPGPHLIDEPTDVEEGVGCPNMAHTLMNQLLTKNGCLSTGRENKVMTNVFEFYKIDSRERKTCATGYPKNRQNIALYYVLLSRIWLIFHDA